MSHSEFGRFRDINTVRGVFQSDTARLPSLPEQGIISPNTVASYLPGSAGNTVQRLRQLGLHSATGLETTGTIPQQEHGIERHTSGLFVATDTSSLDATQPQASLHTPATSLVQEPVSQKGLIAPNDEELLMYGAGAISSIDESASRRGSTDLARALAEPTIFAASEAKKGVCNDREAVAVLNMLEKGTSLPEDQVEHALSRRVTKKVFYDRTTGERDVIVQSRPGPVETAGLAIATLLDDPDLKPMAGSVVLKPVKALLDSSLQEDIPSREMPDLSQKLVSALPKNVAERGNIYDVLGLLKLPESQKQELKKHMDAHGDMDHDLSFRLFVIDRITEQLGNNESAATQEVVRNIPSKTESAVYSPHAFDEGDLQRDLSIDDRPGVVETVALAAFDAIDDPEYTDQADALVISPMIRLIRSYRLHSDTAAEAPDMPDLTNRVLDSIDTFHDKPDVRARLYDLLEQVALPEATAEELLNTMDAYNDLQHPLAFKATVQLAEQNPDSAWLATQQERRNYLLYSLSGSNQDLFERYDELAETARGLVYSGDPVHPREGMVGFEVELYVNAFIKSLSLPGNHTRHYADASNHLMNAYRGNWFMTVDGTGRGTDNENLYNELIKSDDALEHNGKYLADLIRLRQFLGDTGQFLTSMHLHLDRDEHPNMPNLGHLFQGYSHQRTNVSSSVDHNTWELRGFNLPRANGNIDPGRMEDIILMNIAAADEPVKDDPDRLRVSTDTAVDQLTWGHLVTHIDGAEGRLAALMALKDDKALASINPMAFIHSVHEDDLGKVPEILEKELPSDEDQELLDFLKGVVKKTIPQIYNSKTLFIVEHIVKGTQYESIIQNLVYGRGYEDVEVEDTPVIYYR